MTALALKNGPRSSPLEADELAQDWPYVEVPDEGARRAFEAIVRGREHARLHFYFPITRETIVGRFDSLAREWRSGTAFQSSVHDMALHPAYQRIIGMGPAVVPLILAELRRKPDHWFWALKAITGADPVAPTERGNLPAMAAAWLRWGRQQGYKF